MRVNAILSKEIDDEMDVRERRLIGELGLGAAKLLANVELGALQQEAKQNRWDEIFAELDRMKGPPR
jgi:hypothetical protein